MKPILSVVIPHKNSAKSLRLLLETIPDQSRYQVIVVDDGSDAAETRNASSFCCLRKNTELIKNIGPEFNAGVARNIGLKRARGEWVLFADADDVFLHKAFDEIEKAVEKNPLADVVLFKCVSLKENGERGVRADALSALLNEFPKNSKTILYHWLVPWGKLIKRQLLVRGEVWFDSCLASNDVMFSTKLASLCDELAFYDFEIYCCYHNSSSLTSSINEVKALSRLEVLTRRNVALAKNRVPIRKDYGLNYFVHSKPFILSRKKIIVYYCWIKSFVFRLVG